MDQKIFTPKRVLLFTPVIVIAALVIAFALVPQTLYSGYIEAELMRRLAAQGINSRVVGLAASPWSLRVKQASVALSPFFTVELSDLNCSPGWLSLVTGSVNVDCSAKAYSGDLSVASTFNLASHEGNLRFDLKQANLASHPQIMGLGITAGSLSASTPGIKFGKDGPHGTITISGSKVEKPEDSFFSLPSAGLYLAIPKFADLALNLSGELAGNGTFNANFSQDSSLGRAKGDIRVIKSKADGSVNVQLSPLTQEKYGQLISIASSGVVPPQSGSFKVRLSGNWPRLRSKFEP